MSSFSLNPWRRSLSQAGGEELPSDIVDLYSTSGRRSASIGHARLDGGAQNNDSLVPGEMILQSSRAENMPPSIAAGHHSSHPAGIIDKATSGGSNAAKSQEAMPPSWEEEDDSFFSRYWRNIVVFAGIGGVLLLVLIVLIWPRGIQVAVKQIRPAGEEEHRVFMMEGKLGVMVDDILETLVENNNFIPIRIRNATVQGYWLLPERQPLGNGTLQRMFIGPKRTKTIQIPYKMEHLADPSSDPIYQDFFVRCARPEADRKDIDMEYLVTIDLSYLGIKFQRQLNYSYRVPCPVGLNPVNIGKLLEVSGYNPAKVTVKALGNRSLESIIDDASPGEGKNNSSSSDKSDGKKATMRIRERRLRR